MPYPFAHPAAVPDLWYFVPLVSRVDSHGVPALAWFCLPAGLSAYAVFHLILKQPLIALISPRLGRFSERRLPKAPWHAVVASLLAGAATHLAWDALTHSNDSALLGINWAQHASTALGTLVLVGWVWRKLREIPPEPAMLSARDRISISLVLAAAAAWAACASAADAPTLRLLLRSAGMAAIQALGLAIFVYCAVWHFRARRTTSA